MKLGIMSSLIRENSINNDKTLRNSLEKISTGFKINKSSDDASGLAISDKLRTQASGIKQGIENANSAIALTQIADKSMGEISNILDTVKSKLIQAHTNTTSDDGRVAIKKDIEKLLTQIENIAKQTNYNGIKLLSHDGLDFQVGDKSKDIISLKEMNLNLETLSGVGVSNIDYSNIDLDDLDDFIFKSTSYNIVPFPPLINNNETIFSTDMMLKALGYYNYQPVSFIEPTSNNIHDIISNHFHFVTTAKDVSFEIEINSENYKVSPDLVNKLPHSHIVIGNTSLPSQPQDFIIIPENEETKIYFQEVFNIGDSEALYFNDGQNGDKGHGYFILNNKAAYGTWFFDGYIYDDKAINNSIITENRILKFSIFNDKQPGYPIFFGNSIIHNIKINDSNTDNITTYFQHIFYQFPSNINLNNQSNFNCGTLNDLKNMPHEAFTFECAGGFQPVVDYALTALNGYRSEVGSTQNQLESSVRNSMSSYVNIKNAESIIRDVDYAEETANFNKSNIIAQAGSFVQSQANEIDKNLVLSLLK